MPYVQTTGDTELFVDQTVMEKLGLIPGERVPDAYISRIVAMNALAMVERIEATPGTGIETEEIVSGAIELLNTWAGER